MKLEEASVLSIAPAQRLDNLSWIHMPPKPAAHEEALVGVTPRMRDLVHLIEKVASSDAPTVLLEGESGTGKNFIARMIHFRSRRAQQPFMEINCASLPETLIESELFGHERGAYTDAKQMKRGLFEMGQGGTIFLDEIGEMSTTTQAKLLHVIENHRFRRLGGIEDIQTDARIIAATNIHLKNAVASKRFREDLYFRLHLIPLTLPPLRERPEDILIMAHQFIRKFNLEYQKNIQGLSPEAALILKSHTWPGNVRELKNVLERIAILESAPWILPEHLPEEIRMPQTSKTSPEFAIPDGGVNLEDVEKQFILQALEKARNNQCKAARMLGISRHTLRYRMEKFGLT